MKYFNSFIIRICGDFIVIIDDDFHLFTSPPVLLASYQLTHSQAQCIQQQQTPNFSTVSISSTYFIRDSVVVAGFLFLSYSTETYIPLICFYPVPYSHPLWSLESRICHYNHSCESLSPFLLLSHLVLIRYRNCCGVPPFQTETLLPPVAGVIGAEDTAQLLPGNSLWEKGVAPSSYTSSPRAVRLHDGATKALALVPDNSEKPSQLQGLVGSAEALAATESSSVSPSAPSLLYKRTPQ